MSRHLLRYLSFVVITVMLTAALFSCGTSESVPQPPVIVSFSVSPVDISSPQDVTLSFHVTGADTVTIDHSVGDVTGLSSKTVHVDGTTTFSLTAVNGSGTVKAYVTVHMTTPSAPVINSFTATPPNISAAQDVMLSWNVAGADSITIDNGVGTVTGLTSVSVHVDKTTVYTLTATNAGGAVSAKATVNMTLPGSPVIHSFTVSPSNITAAQEVTLSWDVTDATSLSIDNSIGDVTGLTSKKIMATANTTWTLTATNAISSVSAQTTVNLVPPETVKTPVISPATGTYADSVNVTIICATSGASIYYTTDGSSPTASSTLYTGGFQIKPTSAETTVVKAIAVKSGMIQSDVATVQYTITITPPVSPAYVADYAVAKDSALRSIPVSFINTARTTLHVAYFHSTHGTRVSYGVFGLPDFKTGDSTKFGVTSNAIVPETGKLDIHDYPYTGVPYQDLSQANASWMGWVNQVRAYLDSSSNSNINVMMWAWEDITGLNVNSYLSSMQTLINEYGQGGSKIGSGTGKTRTTPVTFIFMTGHAVGNNNTGTGKPNNQAKLITDYCKTHNYFCIDAYSIDSHAMDDTYYEDVDDNGFSTLYGGNFYQDWQNSHTLGVDWFYYKNVPNGTVTYGQNITANRNAFAFWWILARIAGY